MTQAAHRWGIRTWAAASALSVAALPADAVPPQPTGEFQVNTYTTNRQTWPAVRTAPNGDFIVVWDSLGSVGDDTLYTSLQGQRYAADGTPLGTQFQVNSYTTGDTTHPALAVAPDGDFVVVWQGTGSPGPDWWPWSVQGRRYASDGTPQGTQFQINTYWWSSQNEPSVAVAANGDFVVVWDSFGSSGTDTSYSSIQGQRFASDGTPKGAEFQINTYTTGRQLGAHVAGNANGDFVVVWDSNDSGYYSRVRARRFASDGSAQGTEFGIAPYSSFDSSVAADADGNLIVVWDGSLGIRGQRFGANGIAQGAPFQVNTGSTGGYGSLPSVAAASDGDFVVVWNSWGSFGTDTSQASVQARRFAADGSAQGAQFQVNTYTTGSQAYHSVSAAAASDDFVVVWRSSGSYGTDTDLTSIQGERYSSVPVIEIPALSRGAAAAAALLLLLAAGFALRPRV